MSTHVHHQHSIRYKRYASVATTNLAADLPSDATAILGVVCASGTAALLTGVAGALAVLDAAADHYQVWFTFPIPLKLQDHNSTIAAINLAVFTGGDVNVFYTMDGGFGAP